MKTSYQKPDAGTQSFIDAMRDVGWGRIEGALIRSGIPRMTKKTKRLKSFRGNRSDTTDTSCWKHRVLHAQHHKFFTYCHCVGDGLLPRIEIADGLPIYWKEAVSKLG